METFRYEASEDVLLIYWAHCTFLLDDRETMRDLLGTIAHVGTGDVDSKDRFIGYGEFLICNTRHENQLHTILKVNPPGYDILIETDWNELKRLASVVLGYIEKYHPEMM